MADGACFHCGDALPATPATATIDGRSHEFCCDGCAAAANWIGQAGLAEYYHLRSAQAMRADVERPDFSAWDRADVLAEHGRRDGDAMAITIIVEGIRCAACAWLIGRALSPLPGVLEAEANAVTGRLHLRWLPERTPLSAILGTLATVGYRPHLATGEATEQARRAERRDLMKRLLVAGIGTLQAMMFAEALYLDFHQTMPEATRDALRWLTMAVSAPVVFYAGQPFLAGMANELRLRRFGMDTLISTSVLLAWLASVIETVRSGPHVWYDAAVMFVLFLLVARFLERMARQRAQSAVDALACARPALAWRETDEDQLAQVPVHALAPADIVCVRAGETVPADGVLLDDAAELDEALLTGEATPVPRRAGEPVLAGSLAVARSLRMRVTRTGQDTVLSDLMRLVERAQAQRPRAAQVADAIAGRFVLGLLAAAAAVAVLWLQINPERAFEVTLALLIISCPCALSLAIPAALAAAHARLAALGVLVLRGDALDVLARVDTVVLDKTGTLTTGRFALSAVEPVASADQARVLALAAALERHSAHPIASAFAGAPDDGLRASNVQAVAGAGVEGDIDGARYRIGQADFVGKNGEGGADAGAIWLARITAPDADSKSCGSVALSSMRTRSPAPATNLMAESPFTRDGSSDDSNLQAPALSAETEVTSERQNGLSMATAQFEHLARFQVADRLRPDALVACESLREQGLELRVLSGDAPAAVARVAEQLRIPTWSARQRPGEKLDHMHALLAQGRTVAMLGDGINDAPVLAGADVSVALASGAPSAHRAADVVLMGSSLQRLPQTLALARRTRRVIRQNLAWALAYNLIALPVAALGLVTPWLAALGMALSSLLVTANALRLARAGAGAGPMPAAATPVADRARRVPA